MHIKDRKETPCHPSFSFSSLSFMSYELTIVSDDELCQQETEKKWFLIIIPTILPCSYYSSSSFSSCLSFFFCCFSCHIILLHCAANQESIFLRLQVQIRRVWRCVYESCETILYANWLFCQVGCFISSHFLCIRSFLFAIFPVVMTTVELFVIRNRLLPANMHAFTHTTVCVQQASSAHRHRRNPSFPVIEI
jgi:hypothetical protein